jgi:hypothetical protein
MDALPRYIRENMDAHGLAHQHVYFRKARGVKGVGGAL